MNTKKHFILSGGKWLPLIDKPQNESDYHTCNLFDKNKKFKGIGFYPKKRIRTFDEVFTELENI